MYWQVKILSGTEWVVVRAYVVRSAARKLGRELGKLGFNVRIEKKEKTNG